MIHAPETDFWTVGIVPAPISLCVHPGLLQGLRERICWLPVPGPWKYLADPFGMQKDGLLHVFVEAFDYRTKHGVIEHHTLEMGPAPIWRGSEVALKQPVHLSYPFIIEDEGEMFMVPESQRANEVVLYRARQFPNEWTREATLLKGLPVAEASFIRHHGLWWMFFTLVGPDRRDQRELHVAYSKKLTGPWELHPSNPVIDDKGGGRPGGSPFLGSDGKVILPVQDCRDTYGGRLRFVRFGVLEADRAVVEHLGTSLGGELVSATHDQGFHTISACGDSTLIDVKQISRSRMRHLIDWQRRVRRLVS